MPSSRNRSTYLERNLNRLYRESSLRLHHALQPQINNFLLGHWCQVLDSSPEALATLAARGWVPQYNKAYHGDNNVEFEGDFKAWKQWAGKVRDCKPKENTWDAAECLFDVGRGLEAVGRIEEGRVWGQLAEELKAYACRM